MTYTNQQWCELFTSLDNLYGTSELSPLHHSQRCPIHGTNGRDQMPTVSGSKTLYDTMAQYLAMDYKHGDITTKLIILDLITTSIAPAFHRHNPAFRNDQFLRAVGIQCLSRGRLGGYCELPYNHSIPSHRYADKP